MIRSKMITIQKLPSLEPEMRGALRNHIMRKRQRLKQEMEQDAIEKRMKKEREQKRIQDAMTLDQIKEQLATLEKRLETLRSEKHNLFVQLKQVLNEGSSKRKQIGETTNSTSNDPSKGPDEQTKRPKIEDDKQVNAQTAPDQTADTKPPPPQQSAASEAMSSVQSITTTTITPAITTSSTRLPTIKPEMVGKPIESIVSKSMPMSFDSRLAELNLVSQKSSPHSRHHQTPQSTLQQHYAPAHLSNLRGPPPQAPPIGSYDPSTTPINSVPPPSQQHSNELRFGHLPVPLSQAHSFMNHQNQHPDLINFSRHDSIPTSTLGSMSSQQLAALQAHLRGPLSSGSLPGQLPPELLMAGRLDPNFQRFGLPLDLHGRLPLTSMPSDVPMSLSQGSQHGDPNKLPGNYGGPRPSFPGLLDLNGGRWDDRLLAFKKNPGDSGPPYHPNQLLVDGSLPPSLAHLNFLNQSALAGNFDPSSPVGQTMMSLGAGSNLRPPPMNFDPRKMMPGQNVPRSGVDFLLNGMKPGGMLMPNLGPIYTSQPPGSPLMPPTSIYGSSSQIDLEYLSSLYHPSLSQHMDGSLAHFNNSLAQQQHQQQQQHLNHQHVQNLQKQQQEQASRLFSSPNTANLHRKPPPKNPYR